MPAKKVYEVRLQGISVSGIGYQFVAVCGCCEELEVLAWRSREFGAICRGCSVSVINAELATVFPEATFHEVKAKKGGKGE